MELMWYLSLLLTLFWTTAQAGTSSQMHRQGMEWDLKLVQFSGRLRWAVSKRN